MTKQSNSFPSVHVAYMHKSWGMISKIRDGTKVIESRWYITKRHPYDRVHPNDIVYFKESSKPITLRAQVFAVKQFDNVTEKLIDDILTQFGEQIGIKNDQKEIYRAKFLGKRYCILIFLKNSEEVIPFHVSKKGFGNMTAWITVPSINNILLKKA